MKSLILILALLQSVEDIYKNANADFEAERWAEAAAKYEAVLKEDPRHIPSRFNLAVSHSKTGNIDAAISAYGVLLEQNGAIYEARVNLAVLLEENGKPAEAIEQFNQALALRPEDPQAQLNLGMAYARSGDLEKAFPHLTTAGEKGLGSAELYIILAETEHSRKNEVLSRLLFERALQFDPANKHVKHQLAVSHFTEKNYAAAVPLLEDLVRMEPSNADYFYLLGKSYEQLKDYPRALSALQQTLKLQPDYVEAYATLGTIFYAADDWARAAQVLLRVIELRPGEALTYFVLATCFDNLGNSKEAILHYNKFLQLDDGSNDARSFQARQRARTLERRLKR